MYLNFFLQVSGGAGMSNYIMIVLMILVFYLFMIRPQMRRQKKEKTFQSSIKKGAKVVTTSGIHGKIVELNDTDNTCVIETGAGKIKFERSALACVIETGAGKIKFERSALSMELSKKYSKDITKK